MSEPTFRPIPMMCGECQHPLQSTYPGEFVICAEHGSFVDQTFFYDRYGGAVLMDEEAIRECWDVAKKKLTHKKSLMNNPRVIIWMETIEDLWEEAEEEDV